jgi:hypothetical protein
MKQMIKHSRIVIGFLSLAVIVASCRKDHSVPRNTPLEKELVVTFQNSTLRVNDIDSGNIIFRKNGTGTPIFQRFDKQGNTLHTITDGLRTGQWLIELDLYTKKDANGRSTEYVVSKTITLAKETGVVEIKAPRSLAGENWKECAVLATSDNEIVVVIPKDVTDPYFEFRTKSHNWNFFSIERTALFGSAVVAHKVWECQQGCLRSDRRLFDKDIFIGFTEKIKAELWNRNEMVITVGNTAQQQYNEFNYNWAQ